MSRLIIAAGMRRSGSTLQYQLIGDVLDAAGAEFTASWVDEVDDKCIEDALQAPQPWSVMKTHKPATASEAKLRAEDVYVLYSSRDPRDCLVSQLRKYDRPFTPERGNQILGLLEREFDFWTGLPLRRWTRYEEMVKNMAAEVAAIAQALQIPIGETVIQQIADNRSINAQKTLIESKDWESDALRIGVDVIDPKTLLHANHIHKGEVGGWRTELRSSDTCHVEESFGAFIERAGYQRETNMIDRIAALGARGIQKGRAMIRRLRP